METSDANLVAESLSENREAFSIIVARYQTLICSLAYSGTGNLSQSEDLAQETFIAAWKQLNTLHEPHKLRSWLCGIVRNLTCVALTKRKRESVLVAESLEVAQELPSRELLPAEQAITKEEGAILWRSLERIPEIYREPIVLFYREHQSIEAVAEKLGLTEDNVKQRLSRGRKLLHEQVLAFVEDALERTSPGKTFTLGVIAVLPAVASSAKAATVGAAIVKGGAAAKGVMTAGSLGSLFVLLGSVYVSLTAHAEDSKSPRERQFVLRMVGMRMCFILLSFAAFFVAMNFAYFREPIHFDYLVAAFIYYFCVDAVFLSAYQSHRRQQVQIEDKTYVEAEWRIPRRFTDSKADSVRSKMNDSLRLARLAAFGIVSGAMVGALVGGFGEIVAMQQAWELEKLHFGRIIFVAACSAAAGVVLFQLLDFAKRPNLPRFLQLQRSRRFLVAPIIIGLNTLFFFNFRQYVAHTVGNTFNRASPTEILMFNVIVVLAYAAFMIGIRAWKRKNVCAPGQCV